MKIRTLSCWDPASKVQKEKSNQNSRDSPGVLDDFQNNDESDRKKSDWINSYYY